MAGYASVRKPLDESAARFEGTSIKLMKINKRNNMKAKARVIVSLAVVGICATFFLVLNTSLMQINAEVNELVKEYEVVDNENTLLQVKIDSAMSLDSIRKEALSLGMARPTKSNIFFVDVPKVNADSGLYTVSTSTLVDGLRSPPVATSSNNKASEDRIAPDSKGFFDSVAHEASMFFEGIRMAFGGN